MKRLPTDYIRIIINRGRGPYKIHLFLLSLQESREVYCNGRKKWKAVELRLFLLYTGIVLLRDSFGPNLYQHILLLSASIRFLSSVRINLSQHVKQYMKKKKKEDQKKAYSLYIKSK